MSRVRALLLGMWEFRRDVTTHFDDDDLYYPYDWGREFAHRVTFRRWDSC